MFTYISSTILFVFLADLLATSGDIVATWTSPIYPKLQSNDSSINPFGYPITDDQESWIASLVYVGGLCGAFPYGILGGKIGRKPALLAIAVPHIISYLTLAFARNVNLYYFARFLGGFAMGGGYTLLPMYIAEIAQDSNRGRLSVTLNVFWSIGNITPYIIGPYIPIMYFNLILACVPTTFFILFFMLGPETPYYLLRKNRKRDAEKSLMKLRNSDEKGVEEELKHIEDVLKHDERGRLRDLFRSKSNLKALCISIFLVVAQQMSGVTAILLYTQEIFEAAGAKDLPSDISSIIVGLVLFTTSFVAPFLTDRLGRRPLLLISWCGMALAHLAFGIYYNLQTSKIDMSVISWLPITSLVFYIFMLNVGAGSVFWTLSSELFPASVKSIASGLVSFTCWTMAVLVGKFFDDMNEGLGKGGTFYMFCACCLAGLVFTYFFVPETKGKSFKEIQLLLEK